MFILFAPHLLHMNPDEKIEICPKCGHEPKANDYYSNLFASLTGHDVISGRFHCPKCDYHGSALLVGKKDLGKISFDKK